MNRGMSDGKMGRTAALCTGPERTSTKLDQRNFALWVFCEVRRRFLVLWRTLCHGAHTLPLERSMVPSLRGQLTPREGAGQLPAAP
jgi:hypothetical protein